MNTYDDRGNLLSELSYEKDVSESSKCDYEYDENDNRVSAVIRNSVGEIVSTRNDYQYEGDNLLRYTSYNADGSVEYSYQAKYSGDVCIETTETDANGNVIHHTTYDPVFGDELESEYTYNGRSYELTYNYSSSSYICEWHSIDGEYRTDTQYSAEGIINWEKSYNLEKDSGKWVLYGTEEYSLSDSGTIIETEAYADGSKSYRETDIEGNTLYSIDRKADGSFSYACSYDYNSAGQMTRMTMLKEDNSIERYTIYDYNDDGSMKRDITYYADGTKSFESEYGNDNELLHTIFYARDGSLSFEYYYRTLSDGTRQRKIIDYNKDGTVKEEGEWKNT